MFQADPKEGLTLALLVALCVRGATGATVGVPGDPLLVQKLLQLQLKHTRAQNLRDDTESYWLCWKYKNYPVICVSCPENRA